MGHSFSRRSFFGTLAAGVAAICGWKSKPPQSLNFFPKAYALDVPVNYRVARYDVMYGWSTLRPEWVCRVADGGIQGRLSAAERTFDPVRPPL